MGRRGSDAGAVLRAEGLAKNYGDVVALSGVDLVVEAGSVVALLGRNGAGKTTMLSIIAGLLKADSGSVEVDGVDVLTNRSARARSIGIVPQETGIYRVLTVRENLEFFGEIAGMGRRERRARSELVAEQLGLEQLLDRACTKLSGGEARRLHTACALVHKPPLLLLDEPTVGADVGTRNQLVESVRALAADGAAVVYTTHYLPEVEALDAEVVVIEQGRLVARGLRAELVQQYFEPSVEVQFSRPVDLGTMSALSHFRPEPLGGARWRLSGECDLAELVAVLGPGIVADVVSVEAAQPDLEQVFLTITGTAVGQEPDS